MMIVRRTRSFMKKYCFVIKLIGKLDVSHGEAGNV
jgi:hypothetical protein